ncbi:hypothetical protein BFJ65_g10920 [Fusarium oxysporum f. sp. cepae]|uniref:Uncharacterized protein n=1 Tax=Fusarium oxysporum f. sp. cepae TaxID=396571 RepID=A0A3L6NA81_FUSOX|nr:hypothetical protein BFJ65_g10920 [Fusarium oxysporum f. sp. cepae]RKK60058.1 hypothetical protein BFJ67_g2391 [Fusarium oxysporum f. sp. cepae]
MCQLRRRRCENNDRPTCIVDKPSKRAQQCIGAKRRPQRRPNGSAGADAGVMVINATESDSSTTAPRQCRLFQHRTATTDGMHQHLRKSLSSANLFWSRRRPSCRRSQVKAHDGPRTIIRPYPRVYRLIEMGQSESLKASQAPRRILKPPN